MTLPSRLNEMTETLNQNQSIPSHCVSDLEDRLVLICRHRRLDRSKSKRAKSEYNIAARQTRARQIYLEVLQVFPRMFLPFILVYSPTACSNLKDGGIQILLAGKKGTLVDNGIATILETIANRRELRQTYEYKKIFATLFPPRK
jgi:hypothetical protein